MTVRMVPLRSQAASDGRVGGTMADRIALVGIPSRGMWELTKRPVPVYHFSRLKTLSRTSVRQGGTKTLLM